MERAYALRSPPPGFEGKSVDEDMAEFDAKWPESIQNLMFVLSEQLKASPADEVYRKNAPFPTEAG